MGEIVAECSVISIAFICKDINIKDFAWVHKKAKNFLLLDSKLAKDNIKCAKSVGG